MIILLEVVEVAYDVTDTRALDYKEDNWCHKSLFWSLRRLGSNQTRFVNTNLDLLVVEMR
jgi:hypothetical protein